MTGMQRLAMLLNGSTVAAAQPFDALCSSSGVHVQMQVPGML
jgi:hypothetical protein